MMQANAYCFSLVLGVFQFGDGLGIIAGAEWVRRVGVPRAVFLRLQGAVALYALLSLTALAWAHGWFGLWPDLAVVSHQSPVSRLGTAIGFTLLAAFVVLPPAFLLGLSFPLVHKPVQDDPRLVGARVGWVQLANILGNTAGAVLTGLVLLHFLGTTGTLRLIALMGLAMTLWPLLRPAGAPAPRVAPLTLAGALVLALLALPGQLGFWARLHDAEPSPRVSVGEDRTGLAVLRPASARERVGYGMPADLPDARLLYILGHAQSGLPFVTHHGVLGMVGPLVHPAPGRVLVIGHGSGGTPYGVAANPRPAHIRVIEIIGPVMPLLRAFLAATEDAGDNALRAPLRDMFADPRIVHTVADARHVLLLEDARYDVIEADAVYPWSSHAGLLYSREFFSQVRVWTPNDPRATDDLNSDFFPRDEYSRPGR